MDKSIVQYNLYYKLQSAYTAQVLNLPSRGTELGLLFSLVWKGNVRSMCHMLLPLRAPCRLHEPWLIWKWCMLQHADLDEAR